MPATQVSAKSALCTADATSAGLVTIASTTGWLPGALVWIKDNNTEAVECKIVEVVSSTVLRLRALTNAAKMPGAFSDLSAFTLAQAARIGMEQQVVTVSQTFTARDLA